MKTGKVLLGVLAGVATGALLGILLAPDKGSNTRKKILNKGEDYAGDVKEKFNGVLDTITDKYRSVKQDAEGLINNGRVKFDEVQNEIKNVTS